MDVKKTWASLYSLLSLILEPDIFLYSEYKEFRLEGRSFLSKLVNKNELNGLISIARLASTFFIPTLCNLIRLCNRGKCTEVTLAMNHFSFLKVFRFPVRRKASLKPCGFPYKKRWLDESLNLASLDLYFETKNPRMLVSLSSISNAAHCLNLDHRHIPVSYTHLTLPTKA